jgi:hypothetical protein
MPTNITYTSTHPNFLDFGDWLQKKSDDAAAANDTAEVQKIQDAVAKKQALNVSVPGPLSHNYALDGETHVVSVSLPEVSVGCPEFNFYWDQWLSEFSVNIDETIQN